MLTIRTRLFFASSSMTSEAIVSSSTAPRLPLRRKSRGKAMRAILVYRRPGIQRLFY
jgi:hypothetical protein